MNHVVFLAAVLVCQMFLARGAPAQDNELEKDFQNIENALEKETEKETKKELEANLLKLSSELSKKDAAKEETAIEEDLAKELNDMELKKDGAKESKSDAALHAIMKKFESGDIKIGKLKASLTEFINKDSKDLPFAANDVVEADDKKKKCEDTRNDCHAIKKYCQSHKKTMKSKCPKTCGFCATCANKLPDKSCKLRNKLGHCVKAVKAMKEYCFKECGYCKPPGNIPCSTSKFGCCSDRATTRQNTEGDNCPPCTNKYRHACKTFALDCKRPDDSGVFMRTYCPVSCDVCNKCRDDEKYTRTCSTWASLGMCKDMKLTMEVLCKKTCRLC